MNTFEPRHYVPILRWKEAERGALSQLENGITVEITPLIEIVPENFTRTDAKSGPVFLTVERAIYEVAGQLLRSWGERPLFIDFVNAPAFVVQQEAQCLDLLVQYAASLGLSIVPVTGLERDSAWQSAVRCLFNAQGQGVCLRLTLDDIRSPTLAENLAETVSQLGLSPEDVDLVVDLEAIDSSVPRLNELCQLITNLGEWRNFVVAGGAFPKDLSAYRKNEQHSISRSDWALWRSQIGERAKGLRLPNFSDYTIQYARYSPRRRGRTRYSASIRYTVEDRWILMRGEDVYRKGGPGFKQYPDLAIMLSDLPQYCGEGYSSGDRYIKEISLQTKETGAAPQWLQAGINHHITFVVRQLASLDGLPTIGLS